MPDVTKIFKCCYCGRKFRYYQEWDFMEHEDKCPDNPDNIDEGSSVECGDW